MVSAQLSATMSVLQAIGTQEFLPALLTHIRNSAKSLAVPVDLVILQSVLLCLIAGEKNLILRTPDEDVALTVQLAVWVSAKCPKLPFYLCSLFERLFKFVKIWVFLVLYAWTRMHSSGGVPVPGHFQCVYLRAYSLHASIYSLCISTCLIWCQWMACSRV